MSLSLVALVVDDSMLIRFTVGRLLEDRGYSVESATNGEEALDMLKRIRPDLIVTDMQMPRVSGAELISALKSDPPTAGVPIIILSGTTGGLEAEKRGTFVVRKDIHIETQLGKALDALEKGKPDGASRDRAHAVGKSL